MADHTTGESDGSKNPDHSRLPPPSGCYVLLVIGELSLEYSQEIVLERIVDGFKSWNEEATGCNINEELQIIANQAALGTEKPNGERHIQHGSDNVITEILINSEINFLRRSLKNLLISHTKHKHIIYVGQAWEGSGSWILQDDSFTFQDFAQVFHDTDVDRVLRMQVGSTLHLHCFAEGEWSTNNCSRQDFGKVLSITVNPEEKLTELSGVKQFASYLGNFISVHSLSDLLEPSDVAGNIRFSRPTLYIFPAKQGDSALFGIGGFNMLFDGGFGRKPCFWDFSRHLDRIDALMVSRLSEDNISGISNVIKRKVVENVYPQIGCAFFNGIENKQVATDSNDSSRHRKNGLLASLIDEGFTLVDNLKHLGLKPQTCFRNPNAPNLEPVNLYHKVGHGTLDMYILNPVKDSKEYKEFFYLWSAHRKTLATHKVPIKLGGKDVNIPLPNVTSVCALLVWSPSSDDKVTRILFTGSCPQQKIFEALEKAKNMDILKYPTVSESSLLALKTGKVRSKNSIDSSKTLKVAPKSATKPEPKKSVSIPQVKTTTNKTSKTTSPTGVKAKFEPKTKKEEINKKAAEMSKKPSNSKITSPSQENNSPIAATPSPCQTTEIRVPIESSLPNDLIPILQNNLSVKIEDDPPFEKESPPSTPSTVEQDLIGSTAGITSNDSFGLSFSTHENHLQSTMIDSICDYTSDMAAQNTSIMTHSYSETTVDARDEFVFQGPHDPAELENKSHGSELGLESDLIHQDHVSLHHSQKTADLITSTTEVGVSQDFDTIVFEDGAARHGTEAFSEQESLTKKADSMLIDSCGKDNFGFDTHQEMAMNHNSEYFKEPTVSIPGLISLAEPDVTPSNEKDMLMQKEMVPSYEGYSSSEPDVDTEDLDVIQIRDHESLQEFPSPRGSQNIDECCMDTEEDVNLVESDQLAQPQVIEIFREELPSSHGAQAVEEYIYSTEESEQDIYPQVDSEPPSEAADLLPEDFPPALGPQSMNNEFDHYNTSPGDLNPVSHEFDPFFKSSDSHRDLTTIENLHLMSEEKSAELRQFDQSCTEEEISQNYLTSDQRSVDSPVAVAEDLQALKCREISLDFNRQTPEPEHHSTDTLSQGSVTPDESVPVRGESILQDLPEPPHNELSDLFLESDGLSVDQELREAEDFFQHGGNQAVLDSDFTSLSHTSESQSREYHYEDKHYEEKHLTFKESQHLKEQMPVDECQFSNFEQCAESKNDHKLLDMKNNETDDLGMSLEASEVDHLDPEGIEKQEVDLLTGNYEKTEHSRDSHHIKYFEKWGPPLGLPMPPPPDDSPDTPPAPVASNNMNDQLSGVKKTKSLSKTSKGTVGSRPIKKDSKNSSTMTKNTPALKTDLVKNGDKDSNKRVLSARIEKTTIKTEIKQRPASAKAAIPANSPVVSSNANGNGINHVTKRAKSPQKLAVEKKPAAARTVISNKSNTLSTKTIPLPPVTPVYIDLTYIPHHGNSQYSDLEFFRKIRSRYYILSGINPNKQVLDALLEAKQTWEDKQLEVTIIPTYDSDVLNHWHALNLEQINQNKITLAPPANRCTISLQDHETSCLAYRLEF